MRCHHVHAVRAVLTVVATGAALVLSTGPPAQAGTETGEYCTYVGPIYVLGNQVYPGGKYCVPAP